MRLPGFLARIWSAPVDAPLELRMEHRFIAVRWAGICLVAPALPLIGLSPERLIGAYGVLLLAALYNLVIERTLRHRPDVLRSGYITTIADGLLNIMMVIVGGGFSGPFYYILFTTTTSAVMRYGYGPALLVVGMYVTLDMITTWWTWTGISAANGVFLFRSALLTITTMLAGYLREQARAAELALARQLNQASALNESTRALGASLDLDTVTTTIVETVWSLTDADEVILRLGPSPDRTVVRDSRPARRINGVTDAVLARLLTDVQQNAQTGPHTYRQARMLTDDRRCLILPLLSHEGVTGALAIIQAPGAPAFASVDKEMLFSFVDRAALAIENALLYKALRDRTNDVRRAYTELAAAHQELLSVDEMKTNFLANVSHELRTPLTAIRSFSEILLSYDNDRETQQEFLGIINSESERLTRLVNDVLDITKIEAGKMELHMQWVQLDDVLRESARTCATLAEEKGLSFTLELPERLPAVWADRDRVLQVVANLLSNAMKFTNSGGITLRADVVGDEVHTSVADTGIGIPPEHQERIFEKFHQVGDTLTDKPTGTGLGLCISRDILAHQGGRIWVESAIGRGSTFTFSLPLSSAQGLRVPAAFDIAPQPLNATEASPAWL